MTKANLPLLLCPLWLPLLLALLLTAPAPRLLTPTLLLALALAVGAAAAGLALGLTAPARWLRRGLLAALLLYLPWPLLLLSCAPRLLTVPALLPPLAAAVLPASFFSLLGCGFSRAWAQWRQHNQDQPPEPDQGRKPK